MLFLEDMYPRACNRAYTTEKGFYLTAIETIKSDQLLEKFSRRRETFKNIS